MCAAANEGEGTAARDRAASRPSTPAARAYVSYYKVLRQIGGVAGSRLYGLLDACSAGLWLGVLRREDQHAVGQFCYDYVAMYVTEDYNRRGLNNWEERALRDFFQGGQSILVAGAGGGREILALRRLGYEAVGFECHPGLVKFANDLIRKDGVGGWVSQSLPDECPQSGEVYDAVVVGWGVYTLIQGRRQRVEFLRGLRAQTRDGSPLLVSFYHRAAGSRRGKIVKAVGDALRRVRGRGRLEAGDDLDPSTVPNFVHYFTRDEITSELREGGFELVFFSTEGYGHAVALASDRGSG
jgi:hypothetical protein